MTTVFITASHTSVTTLDSGTEQCVERNKGTWSASPNRDLTNQQSNALTTELPLP